MQADLATEHPPKPQQQPEDMILYNQTLRNKSYNTLVLYGYCENAQDLVRLYRLEHIQWNKLKHVNLGLQSHRVEGCEGTVQEGDGEFGRYDTKLFESYAENNLINNEGFRYLCLFASWPNLRYLCLTNNKITEIACLETASWPNTTKIKLFDNSKLRVADIINSMSKLLKTADGQDNQQMIIQKLSLFKVGQFAEFLKDLKIRVLFKVT